jgi:hypothetical protein
MSKNKGCYSPVRSSIDVLTQQGKPKIKSMTSMGSKGARRSVPERKRLSAQKSVKNVKTDTLLGKDMELIRVKIGEVNF